MAGIAGCSGGCVSRIPYKAGGTPVSTPDWKPAEREREGSAAKSIQRTRAHRVVRYRAIAAPRNASPVRRKTCLSQDRHRRNGRRRVPNFCRQVRPSRARLCNTAHLRNCSWAWPVWNETDIRLVPGQLRLQSRSRRNDWKLRSRRRSQARQSRRAQKLSRRLQSSSRGQVSNFFFLIDDGRNRSRRNAFRRHDIGNLAGRCWYDLRLLDPRSH